MSKDVCLNLQLLDHIHLNSRLHANYGCDYSEDGKVFILTENGVYILTLKGYMDNVFPRLSFKRDLIKLTDTSVCNKLGIDLSSFINELPREDLYESLLNVQLCGNTVNSARITPKPMCAMWSPRGIVEKTDGALAVLTNLHNIEVYVEVIDENELSTFVCVVNFAKDISEFYAHQWESMEFASPTAKLLELKRRVKIVIPTTFTWSHVILKTGKACCILFVGHGDGAISAWRFVERKITEVDESRLEFLGRYITKLRKITSLYWFCRKSDAGGLAVGDAEGEVCALSVSKLSTDNIKFSDEVSFNEECDLQADKITIFTHQNITYMVIVKKNYILVYAINEFGEVSQGKLIEVGNLYITGLLHYEGTTLLVLSICGQLKQLDLSLVNNEIEFSEKLIHLNIDSNKYRTHGFLLSPNKVFMGVLAYPCHLKDVSKGKGFVQFFVFTNTKKDPLQTLMNTSANSIRDYWDCLETLRVRSIQEKTFPWTGLDPDLNYDTLPLLKLKILRWVAKLSENVYSLVPQIQEYNIKSYVILNYCVDIKLAVQRMTKLLNIYLSEKKLTLFHMRSLDLLNFFLKEIVAKDVLTKANLGETFVDEIYGVMRIANELQYPPMPQCLWCGEKIIGSTCIPYHLDSRCAISLMPINVTPGYKCPFCKCVVSKEMDQEYYPIFCPYCDVPMKRRYFDKKPKKTNEEEQSFASSCDETVKSDCSVDCLKQDISFDDIEENTADYIVLTDSEDEADVEMAALFQKVKKFTLSHPKVDAEDNPTNTGRKSSVQEVICDTGADDDN